MTSNEREWDKRARALEFEQLSSFRASAEKWRAGLATLTGTVTTVALLKGTDSFDDLTLVGKWLTLSSLGLAFLALMVASIFAMLAAFGHREPILNSGEDLRAWHKRKTETGRQHPMVAQILTPVAVLLLAVGIATTWIDEKPSPPPGLSVQLINGTSICVDSLVRAGDSAILRIKRDRMVVALEEIDSASLGQC